MSNITKASIVAGVAVGLLLVGYLPERMRRVAAESAVAGLRAELDSTQARVRVGALLGQALLIEDLARRADHEQALQQASRFFDAVREEAQAGGRTEWQRVLMSVLDHRDTVIAALAKSDPAVVSEMAIVERQLRETLDYPGVTDPPSAAQPAR